MSTRAEGLAKQFEGLSQDLVSTLESYTPDQMQASCAGEQCTVAALASHVAIVHTLGAEWIRSAASGEPMPSVTMDSVHSMNAEQFTRDAGCPKDEILTSLRQNGAEAAEVVRSLTDEQLDRSSYFELFGREVTTETIVQGVLIGDIQGHSASINAANEVATSV